jgi:hypothetical protein
MPCPNCISSERYISIFSTTHHYHQEPHFLLNSAGWKGIADAQNHNNQPYLITDSLPIIRVRTTPCPLTHTAHRGAIGLSTGLCSCSAEGSPCLVAADEPLAWSRIGEEGKVAYQNQTTGTANYACSSALLLHI